MTKSWKVLTLPPIFHTLCRPPKERLFSLDAAANMKKPELHPIRLCSDEVIAGTCNSLSDLKQQKSVDKNSHRNFEDEPLYIPSFFAKTGEA
jgi:hypothetical protein